VHFKASRAIATYTENRSLETRSHAVREGIKEYMILN